MTQIRTLLLALMLVALGLVAAPAMAGSDLVVTDITVDSQYPLKEGNCGRIHFKIKNVGNQTGNVITKAYLKVYPTGNAFNIPFEKNVFVSSMTPGTTMTRTVQGVTLPSTGQYTIQVLADADQQVNEDNEGNNTLTKNVSVNQSCGGGACDLKAQITWPSYSNLPGSNPAKFSVAFQNIGGSSCPAKTVEMKRFVGSNTNGFANVVATASLPALSAGANKKLSFTDSNHATTGNFTYKVDYQGGHTDANVGNHKPTKKVTFTMPNSGGGGNQGNPKGCDVIAKFIAPAGTSLPGNSSVAWAVELKNQGNAQCNMAKVKLMRYGSRTCTGYGSQVGGSSAWRKFGPLNPGGVSTVQFKESPTPAKGSFCYKLEYSPFNYSDANNNNHKIRRTVSFN